MVDTVPDPDIAIDIVIDPPHAESYGEQARLQHDRAATLRSALEAGRQQTSFWAETQRHVAQRLPAILRTLIAQLRSARREVSTKEMAHALARLQTLGRQAPRHPNVIALRLEIATLWVRVHWVTIATMLIGFAVIVFLLVLLMLIALYLPGLIDRVFN